MKYIKLFESDDNEAFWKRICNQANVDGIAGDEIYNFSAELSEADTFDEWLETAMESTDATFSIFYAVLDEYINEFRKYIKKFPDNRVKDEQLDLIFKGKAPSNQFASDGKDPILSWDDLQETVSSNDYVRAFALDVIWDQIYIGKVVDFILEDPTNYQKLQDAKFDDQIFKLELIEKLQSIKELEPVIRSIKADLWDLKTESFIEKCNFEKLKKEIINFITDQNLYGSVRINNETSPAQTSLAEWRILQLLNEGKSINMIFSLQSQRKFSEKDSNVYALTRKEVDERIDLLENFIKEKLPDFNINRVIYNCDVDTISRYKYMKYRILYVVNIALKDYMKRGNKTGLWDLKK